MASPSYNNPSRSPSRRAHPPPSPSAFFASSHSSRSAGASSPSSLSSSSSSSSRSSSVSSASSSPVSAQQPQQPQVASNSLSHLVVPTASSASRKTSVCSTSSTSSTSSSSGIISSSAKPRNYSPASLSQQQSVVDSYRARYAQYLAASWGISASAAGAEFEHTLQTRPAQHWPQPEQH